MNTFKYSAAGVGIGTRLRTGLPGVQVLVRQGVIIFFEKSRPTLGPQHPTQWVLELCPNGQRTAASS